MEILLYILLTLMLAAVAMLTVMLVRQSKAEERIVDRLMEELEDDQRELRMELTDSVHKNVRNLGSLIAENQQSAYRAQSESLSQLRRVMADMGTRIEQRLGTSSMENEQKLENIRGTVEKRLATIQEDNNKRLDEMRQIVDEKLQRTINERMTQSFQMVNDRLEQVYKGLGEMQSLAVGVGDLKRVLSNVKTRGILGEIQLGAILAEMLAPEQYVENVVTSPRGKERVEFAIKIPGDDDGFALLPIDSKFPVDAYNDLMDAYDSADPARVAAAGETLKARIRGFAKDIRDKYIDPPYTTDFGIMFLPTEGLYAEAVKLGLVEKLQRDYRISIAGPSIMAALLNSLQMGFKTLAIQKRSGEVWQLLGAVKTEFDKFGQGLSKMQQRLRQTDEELDNLIGVRSRAISRKLRAVQTMDESAAAALLELDAEPGRPVAAKLPENGEE